LIIQQAHKIRLVPNNRQKGYLSRACGVSRFTYNWALNEWGRQYDAGEKPSPFKLKKEFNAIKQEEFPFVTEVTKCASEQAFSNLGVAFKKFFKNLKQGKKPGYPRFKKRGRHDSFYLSNDKFSTKDRKVRIPKLGWVKMREGFHSKGRILSATVSKIANKWFIAINFEQEVPASSPIGPVLGVDVGIKTLATLSNGQFFENPRALRKKEPRLHFLQKAISRKKRGSKNRKKAIEKLQRQYYRVSCIRKDHIHKATTAIIKSCSVLGVEGLNVKGMLKNHKLAKALSDASLSEFLHQLEYKAKWRGVEIIKADRFFPSSKTCANCGCVKEHLDLGERIYQCEECGFELDRDLNAAIVLKDMAVGSTVTACRLGSSGSLFESETTDWAGISHVSAMQIQ